MSKGTLTKWPKSEQELGSVAVAWLEARGWEVWQEVVCLGSQADIVARQGSLLWVIECKTRFSFEVIGQAEGWRRHAHLVSVAVPRPATYEARSTREYVMRRLELGLLYFHEDINTEEERWGNCGPAERAEVVKSPFARQISSCLKTALERAPKDYITAGAACQKGWTPYKQTHADVLAYVRKHPGTTLKEVVENIKTHYHAPATARRCISEGIKAGWMPGITLKREGRTITLHPESNVEATNENSHNRSAEK